MNNFSDPQKNLERIGVPQGITVVDLGTGSGHYAIAAARMVGKEGRVYAVDIQKDLLDHLKRAADNEQLKNIEVFWGDIERVGGSKVASQMVDLVLVCNVLFQAQNKESIIQEATRLAKPNGRVVVIDWSDSHFGLGPAQELIVSSQEVIKHASKYLILEKEFEAGEHHYGLIFRKNLA